MQGRRIVGGLCLAATLLLWGAMAWLVSQYQAYEAEGSCVIQPYEPQGGDGLYKLPGGDSWPDLAEKLTMQAAEDDNAVRTLSDEELLEKLAGYGCMVGSDPFGSSPEVMAALDTLEKELRAEGLYFYASRMVTPPSQQAGRAVLIYTPLIAYDVFRDCFYVTSGGRLEQEDIFFSFGKTGQCEVFLQFETDTGVQPKQTQAFLYDLDGSVVTSGCTESFAQQRAGVQLEIPRNFPIEYFSVVTTVNKGFIEAGGSMFTGYLEAEGRDWYRDLDYQAGSFSYRTNAPEKVFVHCSYLSDYC